MTEPDEHPALTDHRWMTTEERERAAELLTTEARLASINAARAKAGLAPISKVRV